MKTLKAIYQFYYQGFSSMTIGKTLWLIILVKLFIMFGILKVFFFRSALSDFETGEEKATHIRNELRIDR